LDALFFAKADGRGEAISPTTKIGLLGKERRPKIGASRPAEPAMATESSPKQPGHTPPDNSTPRGRPKLRFGLRSILLAVTLFAIALPLWQAWYGRPYAVRQPLYPTDTTGAPDRTSPPLGERRTEMKRVALGDPVSHGVTSTRLLEGGIETTQEFVNGVAHGQYTVRRMGVLEVDGQYHNDQKHGDWFVSTQGLRVTQQWRHGRLHGELKIEDPDGATRSFTYNDDVLTHRDGRPVSFPIFQRLAEGEIPAGEQRDALLGEAQLTFAKTPLADVAWIIEQRHPLSAKLDPTIRTTEKPHGPEITADCRGLNLITALAVLADDAGLACDYRDGAVWFVRP
jgi:hypothetical protein